MKTQTKLEARIRVAQILDAALDLAPRVGYNRLTRDVIATRAGISPALVTHHMGTMAELRRCIMREAVHREHLPVIAQGLACQDRHAMKAPDALRRRALEHLLKSA